MHPHVRFFVMGVAVGLVVGGLVTSVIVGSSGPAPKALASAETADQVRQLAQACVSEARRQCMDASHTDRERTRERDRARVAESAEHDLDEIEKRALAEKRWTKAASLRARGLLRRASDDARRGFETRIVSAIDGGKLELEDGAWKPGSSDHPPAPTRPKPRSP